MANFNSSKSILYIKNFSNSAFNIHGYSVARTMCQKPSSEFTENPKQKQLKEDLAKAKPYEEMPKLPMVPFIGSVWVYFPIIGKFNNIKMNDVDLQKRKIYGDIVREKFQKFELVSCYHPNAMEVIASHEGRYPSRAEFSTIKAYREKRKKWFQPLGLVVMQGKDWFNFRRKVARHVMSPVIRNLYYNPLHDVGKECVKLIRSKRDSKNEVHITEIAHSWALEAVGQIALDTRFGCLDPNPDPESDGMKMINSVRTQLACIKKLEASSANFPFWKYFPTPMWRKFTKAADVFTDLAFKYIELSLSNSVKNRDKMELTMLQNMLLDEEFQISDVFVAVSDIMMAGIDTSAHAACYVLYNLAKNPQKQEIAYQEIMRQLPGKEDKITQETKLQYLQWCIKEALRLNPVVKGNLRIFDHDVAIQGYRIPAGTAVLCLHQLIYRDERFFENPNEFIPERWANLDSITPFSFLPFGHGKRSCLGQTFANMELVTLVTEVLRNFSLEYHYEEIGMLTRLINVPDRPINLRFLER